MWEELSSYESPELARLATAVSGSVIWSRADNTAKKYLAAFRQWKGWAHQHSLQAFPVKVAHLVLHMQSVADSTGSKAAVEEAYNAMAWIHAVGDCHSPSIFQDSVARPTEEFDQASCQKVTNNPAERSRSLADLRLGPLPAW